jgi:hypothetical protein
MGCPRFTGSSGAGVCHYGFVEWNGRSAGQARHASTAASVVSQILANPREFDGNRVTVSGSVRSVDQKVSRRGYKYETFELCERVCIKVLLGTTLRLRRDDGYPSMEPFRL